MKAYTNPGPAKKPSIAKQAMAKVMKATSPKKNAVKLVLGKYKNSKANSGSGAKPNLSVSFK